MGAIRGATASVFERFSGDIYTWAYRLLGCHHDALDVVQEVFLRWSAQCAREAPAQPRGWLRRVTVNRAIDLRRRRKSEPSTVAHAEGLSVASAPNGALDHELLRQDIAAAMDQLTDMQRSTLIAKIYDDMTFRDIAEELGLGVSTVKTHYVRAIRAVRNRLYPRWAEEDR